MELREIEYRVATTTLPLWVTGKAICLPAPWQDIRLCVRQNCYAAWQIDHYPTGLHIDGFLPPAKTRESALKSLVSRLSCATKLQLQILRSVDANEAAQAWKEARRS